MGGEIDRGVSQMLDAVGLAVIAVCAALVGAIVPSGSGLEFTFPAMFVAPAASQLRDGPAVVAAVTGAAVTALALELPYGLGLLIGALAGAAAVRRRRRTS